MLQPDSTAIAAEERRRDRGLVRGVGVAAFTATIVNGVVGAGIFKLPAAMAASVGTMAPLAYLACAVAMGAVVLCCAEAGSRVPTSGGLYGYIEAGLGPLPAFVGGFLGVWMSAVLACGALAAGLADAIAVAIPAASPWGFRTAIIVAVLSGFAFMNTRGVTFASRFIAVATVAKLLPLGLLLAVGVWYVDPANFTGHAGAAGEGFGRAVIFALFAFSGMETPLAASGEIARPARTVPRALIAAMLIVLVLYISLQLVAQGLLGPGLATARAPLADAIGVVSPALRAILLGGTAVSMLFWIAGDLFGAPRALFAFARDGLLPAWLGGLHPRTKVPHRAIMTHAVIAMALAVSGTFEQLAILAALATTILYSLACLAAWSLQRRGIAALGEPVRFRLLPAAAVVGIAAMAWILVQGEPAEIIATLATAAGSAVIYLVFSRRAGLPST